jgi:hypothetical protein
MIVAQKSFPSLADNPNWKVVDIMVSYPEDVVTFSEYQLEKDTLINSATYQKITNNGGYIRLLNDKVYYRLESNSKDFLLYDFGLNVNDTMYCGFNLGANDDIPDSIKFWVVQVDSVTLEDGKHKRLQMHYNPREDYVFPMDWIEGVGSTTHPFYPSTYLGAPGSRKELLCLHLGNTKIFQNPSFVFHGDSQKYHPIVNETNNWSVLSVGFGTFLKVSSVQTNHYRFEGDTIIQSTDYKKILSSTDPIDQTWETIGFIREDTIQKKVWMRDLENQEGLVYDFDLSPEEEITLYNPFFREAITYKVSEIDSILIQTEYRKTFVLTTDDGWEEKWIEGIGSEFGIVNSNILNIPGGRRELLCFSDHNIQYVNPKFETCHKTGFSPAITNQNIDTAVINENYSFQITTTEIFDYDSISYSLIGSQLPTGLSLNNESGLISGIPTELGTFHLFIGVSNNGYVTDYWETDLVVDDNASINSINSDNQVQIYPNPCSDHVIIKGIEKGTILNIFNSQGQVVLSNSIKYPGLHISTRNWTKGVYLVQVIKDNNSIFNQKITKQ